MAVRKIEVDSMSFDISYDIVNKDKNVDCVILHGWGSNKELMKSAFSKYMPHFRHIYIDLPGFGGSSNDYSLTTKQYFTIIDKLLESLKVRKDIVIGHSFGGKVALLLDPKMLVLLSSAGILVKKPLKVRMKITLFKALKPFGGEKFYKLFATKDVEGMSKNMYETLKNVVDEDFSSLFSSYGGKALIFWGKEDRATPLSSGRKIASLIKESEFVEMEGDHYFFLRNSSEISQIIEEKYFDAHL
ncbi:MAG: alpha/beta hydrolase [Epsilonproteobacteria bacterium]|nr:alpha/beta hydrolase [Campylobacterota bacterium]